jgi:hypothetical protein
MGNRFDESGYEQIYRHDRRRGVWRRVLRNAATGEPEQVDLCAGREGDDHAVTLRAGDTVTPLMLLHLADILAYARHAHAAFTPYGYGDTRVDWSMRKRPGSLGGECAKCFHVPPLHEPACRALPCMKPDECGCRACFDGVVL